MISSAGDTHTVPGRHTPGRANSSRHEATPVFLTGYPKSGTTLLLSLLDGHSALNVFPKETLFFQHAMPELEQDVDVGLRRFVARIFEGVLFGLEEVLDDPVDARRFEQKLREAWAATGFSIPRFLDTVVRTYGSLIGRGDAQHWIEKTPHTELYVPLIREWYPDARVIHCLRDPRANYAAIRRWNERDGRPTSPTRFAAHWSRSWSAVERNRGLLPQLELRYEDLVGETEREMRRACEFLDIEFEPILLEPTLGGASFAGNSMFEKSFSGVSRSSIDRWRTTLPEKDVAILEDLLRHEMMEIGHEPVARSTGVAGLGRLLMSRLAFSLFRFYDDLPEPAHRLFRRLRKVLTGIESRELDPDA